MLLHYRAFHLHNLPTFRILYLPVLSCPVQSCISICSICSPNPP